MSNQRLLALGMVFLTALCAYVLSRFSELVLTGVGVGNPEVFGGLSLAVVLGVVLAIAAFVVAWMNSRVQEVGQEVTGELKKVSWPTWPEIRAATLAVMVSVAISAVFLGLMDFLSAKVMSDWIPAGIRWAQGLFA